MCRIDGVEVDAAIQDKRAQAQAKRAAVVFQTPDPGGPLAGALAEIDFQHELDRRRVEVEVHAIRRTSHPDSMCYAVWKSKFYGAFAQNHRIDLHAIDATPAR